MKKLLRLMGVLVLIFTLTGCIKYNALMEIRKDKSMDFSIIYAMNKSILEMSEEQEELINPDQKKSLIEQGFTVEDYEDSDNKGFKLIKKISNIDDFSLESDIEYSISGIFEENNNDKIFKVIKGKEKNKYIANFKFDSNDSEQNNTDDTDDTNIEMEDGESTEDLSQLGDAMTSTMDLKFVVKLPNSALSNNATEKNENETELTWKLNAGKVENIKFEFELNNKENSSISNNNNKTNFLGNIDKSMIIAIVSLGIGIISLTISIIFFIKSEKNN